jgi:hypothetical protein
VTWQVPVKIPVVHGSVLLLLSSTARHPLSCKQPSSCLVHTACANTVALANPSQWQPAT